MPLTDPTTSSKPSFRLGVDPDPAKGFDRLWVSAVELAGSRQCDRLRAYLQDTDLCCQCLDCWFAFVAHTRIVAGKSSEALIRPSWCLRL